MKAAKAPVHSPTVEQILVTERHSAAPGVDRRQAIKVAAIYETHADFLWRSLQHLGICDADLEDAVQEVLVVVHRRRDSFSFECRLTTWLFGICLRIASRHRRRAYLRWERVAADLPEQIDPTTPEDRLVEERARARLDQILSKLSPEHRAAFVMFEIEGQTCSAIAELFGVPLGTIYSRLHAARKQVEQALARQCHSNQKGSLL